MILSIESAVKQLFELNVDGTAYTIEFPLSAVIQAEEKVGHSLRHPQDWFGAPAKDIPALLAAGLSKHHPEVTDGQIQKICDSLNPEACNTVTEALGALAFPRFAARLKEMMEKAQPPKDQSAGAL